MEKKILCIFVIMLLTSSAFLVTGKNVANEEIDEPDYILKPKAINSVGAVGDGETLTVNIKDPKPLGLILVFGLSVEVKILQLDPEDDYVDLEILNKPLYIWEDQVYTYNPGEFIRLYGAKGLFSPSFPLCIGTCTDWDIIG